MAREVKNQIQVIGRAAEILRCLSDAPNGLSLGQIAKHVGLARSTVQRIVGSLLQEGLAAVASPTGRVKLGPAILRLAASIEQDFVALSRPYLIALSDELQETVDLAAVKHDHLLFIDQIVGPHRLRTVSAVAASFPLHCTANGKAFLANLPDTVVQQLIGTTYKAFTPKTITRFEQLRSELKTIRQKGVAFDIEEHTIGVCAAGVSFSDTSGNHIAISVPVPTTRFALQQARIAKRLLATKQAIEKHLGSGDQSGKPGLAAR